MRFWAYIPPHDALCPSNVPPEISLQTANLMIWKGQYIRACLGVHYPWLTIGIPAIPSLYFDWFSGCIQAFIFCTLTTLFIKQAAG